MLDKNEPRWIALFTMPQSEKKVVKSLAQRGIEAFCPLAMESHQWSDRVKKVEMPIFPMYVFAKVTTDQVMPLFHITGVVAPVRKAGERISDIVVIPDKEIELLRRLMDSDCECSFSSNYIPNGKKVVVTKGSLAGLEGRLVTGNDTANFAVNINAITSTLLTTIEPEAFEVIE